MDLASTPRGQVARARAVAVRAAVGLSVGGILILAFLRLVNMRAVFQRLEHLNIGFALLCGAAFVCAYVVRAVRWRCLLSPYQVSVPRAVAIYQVATFINWLLPIRGGELAKSLLLRRSNGIPVSRSLATVSMDKTMDLLPALVLLSLVPFAGLRLSGPLWLLLLSALAVVGFVAVAVVLAAWRPERAVAFLTWPLARLGNRASERAENFVMLFVETLLGLIRRPRLLAVAAAFTGAAVGLDALFCLLAFKAVGIAVAVPVILYGYTFFNLSFILPTPPGQVGSNELVGLLIFSGLFRVSRPGVGAMFLFSHPWTAVLMTCTGLTCLSAMGLSLRSTWRLVQGPRR